MVESWSRFNALVLIGCTFLTIKFGDCLPLVYGSTLSFVLYFITNFPQWSRLGILGGLPNQVGAGRVLLIIVALIFHESISREYLAGILFASLFLDFWDGYLARQFNATSLFGTYLDRETDAFFVLATGAMIYCQELLGVWVLIPGLLRYFYVILLIFIKPPEQKETRSFLGQTIAVLLMGGLLSCFILEASFYQPIVIFASVLVVLSFANSFIQTLRLPSSETEN